MVEIVFHDSLAKAGFTSTDDNRELAATIDFATPNRDAFMGFTVTFDAILQFHAEWWQELRDGKDSSRLQVCSSWPIEA